MENLRAVELLLVVVQEEGKIIIQMYHQQKLLKVGKYLTITSRNDSRVNRSGLTEEEISEFVWIINNYATGDTIKDSVFNYEDNTYYDISNDTYYNIDDYNVYYFDDRNTYHKTNNEYNFYVTYNITNVSYTYFEPVQKQIITSKHFYKLPDGRNSADLTADEILGLNLDFEVIKYEENAVDTITKGLYHFEGNYKDSSYYKNDITVFDTQVILFTIWAHI